jgi:hypothetical protein
LTLQNNKSEKSKENGNLDFFLVSRKQNTSSMHEAYQSEQVILFDASSLCSDIDITFMKHTYTLNQLLDSLQISQNFINGSSTSTKRSVEFQLSQWNSTKNETFELICLFFKVLANK